MGAASNQADTSDTEQRRLIRLPYQTKIDYIVPDRLAELSLDL